MGLGTAAANQLSPTVMTLDMSFEESLPASFGAQTWSKLTFTINLVLKSRLVSRQSHRKREFNPGWDMLGLQASHNSPASGGQHHETMRKCLPSIEDQQTDRHPETRDRIKREEIRKTKGKGAAPWGEGASVGQWRQMK